MTELTIEELDDVVEFVDEHGRIGLRHDKANAILKAARALLYYTTWHPMDTAPKGATPENICKEHWILGIDHFGHQRVIRWCMEYPYSEGVWMFAYEPRDYIDGIQTFEPIGWKPLLPKLEEEE